MHVQVQFYAGQQRPAGQRLGCTCLFFLKNKITIQLKTKTKNKIEIEIESKTKAKSKIKKSKIKPEIEIEIEIEMRISCPKLARQCLVCTCLFLIQVKIEIKTP